MNFQKLFVTHVEVSPHHFIKIHGQTNREMAIKIDNAMPTIINIFSTYPAPDLNMLHTDCKVLVYYNSLYYRGKFISSDAETANILLIDFGYSVNIELANVRVMGLTKASQFFMNEPALANEFILNRCIIVNDNLLSKIHDEIVGFEAPYIIDDEIGDIKRISLKLNGGRDYADHLINIRICQALTAESQKKYLVPKSTTLSAARPINKAINNNARSSINTSGMQMISNHLGVRTNKVPQNMPSFHPRVSPSMDFNLNHTATTATEQLQTHYLPTFISDTLIVHGRHQVYVSFVDDGPCMFSIQLKSAEQKMEQMMADLANCPLEPLSRKPALGMACLARFSRDNCIYRAVVKSINPESCQLLYVDYGNSETVVHNNIYDIPQQFLRLKTFAIRVSLAGLNTLPALAEPVKNAFKNVVADKVLDMVVVPPDGKAFVQYCELSINGESMLNRLKDIVAEIPRYIEPTTLKDGDYVVIRYVESPKLFCVQQTKNIVEYNAMMDKLLAYCMTARQLTKFHKGIACAARFKNDSEWYRAEIVNINGTDALIRFVDYGIELNTEINELKEIRYDFLIIPKQAVRCCLLGFDSMQTFSNSSQDQMELLAEDSLGERRNFRVKIEGKANDAILVNLIDESQLPHLNLSMRMLQLSLPQKSFRQYELRLQNKGQNQRSTLTANDASDQHHAALNEKATSDSGFQDCATTSTRISSLDTSPQQTHDRDSRVNARNNSPNTSRDDSGIASTCNLSSPGTTETFKIDVKESKFYKNTHGNEQRISRPLTSSNLKRDPLQPEGPVDPNVDISVEAISFNNIVQVKSSWFISPLNFYVTTVKSDADLEYTTQMKDIHHFYKNKSPITKTLPIGSLAIVRYSKTNQLLRAKIIDYNDKLKKYKAQLIDVGALTVVNESDVYEMDKIFAKLDCQAIRCSFSGVAIRSNRFDLEAKEEKLMGDRILNCKFIKKKGDTFIVDIHADGLNVRDVLVREKYLSKLAEDIEIERLVGQTVIAKIVSIKDLTSFLIVICGCETIFEASYTDANTSAKSADKKLPTGGTVPIRIDSLSIGKTFCVTPLIDSFGETPPAPICTLPFFANNFEVMVMHWESYNVAYVQSISANNFVESLLNQLFEFYENGGELQQVFTPQTVCAVKSTDSNWYRAEIISETQTGINVRYLDYGNCELIPKDLVKRLDAKFYNQAALAVKVFLPLQKVYSNRETSVDEIGKLTADVALDLKVLDFHEGKWIVDLLQNGVSITSIIKTKNCCKTLRLDEMKKLIDDVEVVQKVNRLQEQKQRANSDVKVVTPVIADTQPTKAAVPATQPSIPSANKPTTQPDTKPTGKTSTRTKAYISHIDRPDRFYLQLSSVSEALDQLQVDIQIVAPSLPALEDFSTDTRCIVRYSVDDQWYRAAIIDSDSKITSVLFIDYGNTDTITDNSMIKSMNVAFDQIPPYAIPCALPLEAKDRIEWSEESCEILKNLVDNELEFDFVCKGKSNNLVNLYQGDRDITQELIQSGFAIKLESIAIGANCYISHVNSISDFYIQMESDTATLEKVSDYLLDESKFEVMTDIKDGVVCAAKYSEDNLWYRGKIISHSAESTEVCFIDYGNTSLTNELRIIPTEIASAPSLAKYCSMVKPKDIQYWSDNAERRFVELTDSGTIFLVDVISPGKKSIVDLFVNEKSILEEISSLCDKYSLSALENTLQSNASVTVPSESFKASIVDGSPSKFYIQLETESGQLDDMWISMEKASEWPVLEEIVVGRMCAALYEGDYYRAKIVSLSDQGATVHYVDYGNQSVSVDLRQLPENLENQKHLSICCRLESKSGNFSPQLIERFNKLSRDVAHEMKFVCKDTTPAIVQLFENGVKFEEITAPAVISKVKAFISELVSPNHFYIQLNNDMEEPMTSASEFPSLEDSGKCAGKRCAALWEGAFYRAEILSIDEEGIKVHFIDYGNESYATDLRKLPDHLEKIERASMLCTLENENDEFTSDFLNQFTSLDLDKEYEFEVIGVSSPRVVRLYVDGELLSDRKLDGNSVPNNGHGEANSDNIVNGIVDSGATINDIAKEAKRIEEVHFNSIASTGLGSYPA